MNSEGLPEDADLQQHMRRALQLWLVYDERRTQLVSQLYRNRADAERVQQLLDDNEILREQAVTLTKQLLK